MGFAALVLPWAALNGAGGFGAFQETLIAISSPHQLSWTAGNTLLVAASAIAHDLGPGRNVPERSLLISRLTIIVLVLSAVVVALYLPEKIFSRVLFAWIALGSAFGPTVVMRLAPWRLHPAGVLLSILIGFSSAVVFYLLPDSPGDILERMVPFCAGLAVLFLFRMKPDAAGTRL